MWLRCPANAVDVIAVDFFQHQAATFFLDTPHPSARTEPTLPGCDLFPGILVCALVGGEKRRTDMRLVLMVSYAVLVMILAYSGDCSSSRWTDNCSNWIHFESLKAIEVLLHIRDSRQHVPEVLSGFESILAYLVAGQ